MRFFALLLASLAPLAVAAQQPNPYPQGGPAADLRGDAEQIFALANQARHQAGLGRLEWDASLSEAALAHCRRMALEGPIAHRYGGELDVAGRAALAGAHFSVIEENVAIGPSAPQIHQEWMGSPGHRANLLSPQVDRVGVAVVAAHGVLYAVADYSHAVQNLSAAAVEARVARLIRPSGLQILGDPAMARAACNTNLGIPSGGPEPRFIMRWQSADLSQLPKQLAERLSSGRYRQAEVGSCPAHLSQNSFSAYRVAVLLY